MDGAAAHLPHAKALFADWDALLDTPPDPDQYADADLCAGRQCGEPSGRADNDTLIAAAGGIPGEVAKGWRVKAPNTFDLEFGFSCMGYEIAAGWGCAMAQATPGGLGGTPIVMLGDGTYMMMNSDIYSTVLSGHKMIVVVCDNGGYAVISRLQQFKGVPGLQQPAEGLPHHRQGQPAACRFCRPRRRDGGCQPQVRKPGRP